MTVETVQQTLIKAEIAARSRLLDLEFFVPRTFYGHVMKQPNVTDDIFKEEVGQTADFNQARQVSKL